MASPTLITPCTSKSQSPFIPLKPKSTISAAVTTPTVRRRDFLSLSASVLAPSFVLFPQSPALAASDDEYVKDTNEVIGKVRTTITMDRNDPNVAAAVADLRESSNSWVAKYRKEKALLGRASFRDMYSALNAVSGHYISFGPTAPIPAKRKARILPPPKMQANTNTIGALVQTYITSHSEVQKARLAHTPSLPSILHQPFRIEPTHETSCAADADAIKQLFPYTYGQHAVTFVSSNREVKHEHHMNVGIVLSGGPAPGGHNVISGLFDYLTYHHVTYKAYGFLDGPSGIIDGKYITITDEIVRQYRNAGGFHMIGSGRTKIETPQQFTKALATVQKLELDGLIVVGGDDSNTNAALLAEFFKKEKCRTKVIGVPKTIDGDLRNEYVETSFGFDTATKVYSEKIAALADDAVSARKTYHFCRLMGRTASHITLECALQTHPNIALIGEEIKAKKITLHQLVGEIADVICARAARGKNYGIVILPEGLVDFLVDISQLLQELDELIASAGGHPPANVAAHLSEPSAALFGSLPTAISSQLLLDRDPHGNVQVSKIESERLLAQMVEAELNRRKQKNLYGGTPNIVCHFLGYEGRCGLPSNFDVNYCYALGHVAGALLSYGYTGMMAVVSDLTLPVEQWKCGGMPLTHMMNIERRKGHSVPVIRKALVDLNSAPFQIFAAARDSWKLTDSYRNPGSIQYFGPLANSINLTLAIEKQTEQYQRQQANLKNAIQSKL